VFLPQFNLAKLKFFSGIWTRNITKKITDESYLFHKILLEFNFFSSAAQV